MSSGSRHLIFTLAAVLGVARLASAAPPRAVVQRPAASEKESRTPAQRKIDSQLLNEIYRLRGETTQRKVPPGHTGVKIDEKQRALVDVRVEVTPEQRTRVESLGGSIVSTSQELRSIVAWIPLLKLEQLADDTSVSAIVPPAEATIQSNVEKGIK